MWVAVWPVRATSSMRHEAAYERRASLWEDLGIGVAVAAMAAAVVIGIGLWSHYVTGVFFILATAILAWHSGFRPALVTTVLSTAALGPLVHGVRRAGRASSTCRSALVSIARASRWWCRGCAATCIDRASGC